MHHAQFRLPSRLALLQVQSLRSTLCSLPYVADMFSSTPCIVCVGELHGSPLVRLSLETLGRFNFTPIPLLEFTRDHVLPWLDDPDTSVRKAATLTAAHILNRHVSEDNKRPARNPVRYHMKISGITNRQSQRSWSLANH